jgi:hypothetical protein
MRYSSGLRTDKPAVVAALFFPHPALHIVRLDCLHMPAMHGKFARLPIDLVDPLKS